MDHNFWHQKWEANQIAFHQSEANALLVRFFESLQLKRGDRIYLPLCGKTRDIAWLLDRGYSVVGAELSPLAIDQLFVDLDATPEITKVGEVLHYRAPNIDIFVGDIFDVTKEMVGQVDAVYDRAAYVALPEDVRKKYADHLVTTTKSAPQLLITFEYDQSQMDGPPFSISAENVRQNYGSAFSLTHEIEEDVVGGLKGLPATEHVWRLEQKS